MEAKKKVRAKAGDVFQIPIDEERVSFGQVSENNGGVLRIITFNKAFPSTKTPDLREIIENDRSYLMTLRIPIISVYKEKNK